ncbi:MAG: L-asparaginase [Planctomycetota bacterium]|nr:MAG: L-asparaginase [Planctomycetota bacterium]
MKVGIVVHGGVGTPSSIKDGCEKAIQQAKKYLNQRDYQEAALQAAVVMEDDERYNAGYGSNLRLDGKTIEMDAAFMTENGQIGAVAAVQKVRNPVLLAREVWHSPHVLLAGQGAQEFAKKRGLPFREEIAPTSLEKFERMKKSIQEGKLRKHPLWKDYSLKEYWNYPHDLPPWGICDTIGVVTRDGAGGFCAALSTGGAGTMMMGRIGDTPLAGSGFYVGPKGAVVATGLGEAIIQKLLSFRVYMKMEEGYTPQEACEWGISLYDASIPIGLLAISEQGIGAGHNWDMAWAGEEWEV